MGAFRFILFLEKKKSHAPSFRRINGVTLSTLSLYKKWRFAFVCNPLVDIATFSIYYATKSTNLMNKFCPLSTISRTLTINQGL